MDVIASSRCRICLHRSKNGGRSKIAQNSKVRVSVYVDTSSTTQMAQIMVKTEFVRTSTSWLLVEQTVRGSSNGTWKGKSADLGMPACPSKTRIILIGMCG